MLSFRTFIQTLLIASFCSLKSYAYLPARPCEISAAFEYQITKVFLENTNFVSSQAMLAGPAGYDQQNIPSYRPTYRGELAYTFRNGDQISVAGSYYKSSSVAKAANSGIPDFGSISSIVPTQGIAALLGGANALIAAASRIDLQFYNIEALYNILVYRRGPLYLNLLVGTQVANVQYNERIFYGRLGFIDFSHTHLSNVSSFVGVGPDLGIEIQMQFLRSSMGFFTLNANFSGSLLASYTKARSLGGYSFREGGSDYFQKPNVKRANWTWNPVWSGKCGLNYLLTRLWGVPSLELGVRFSNYCHAVEKLFIVSAEIADAFNIQAEYSNVGFFSPYVAVQVNF